MTALFHFLDLVLLVIFLTMSGYLFHEGSLKRARRKEALEESRLRETALVNAQLNAEHERMLEEQAAADKHRLMDTLIKTIAENPDVAVKALESMKPGIVAHIPTEKFIKPAAEALKRYEEVSQNETTWHVPRITVDGDLISRGK
jgi:hypothetical protein